MVTCSILLDEPKSEVHLFSSHVLPLPHVVNSPFGLHIRIYIPFYIYFFRRSPNLSLYIALLPRRSPPPWVYPWRAFFMGPMWHSQHLLPLLLHLRFLPKLPPLLPSQYPEKRVLILKGLVRLHLFQPRHLLLQREPFLLLPFRPRPLPLFCHLLFSPMTPLRPSPRLQRTVLLWLLLLPPFPVLLHVVLT